MTMLNVEHAKRAEQELARVKDQLALILESAGEGIYGLDAEGRATFINHAGAAMFGYRQDELLGRNLHALLHYAHPDGRPYAREDCPIEAVLRDGRVQRGDDQLFWRKDGTPLPVSFTSSPIEEEGRVTGAVVVLRDIADRRRAQETVTDSEERFRRAADSAGAAVYDIDLAHPQQAVVHGMERLAGLTRQDIRFELEWWTSRIHPDDLAGYLAQLHGQLERGGVVRSSFRLKHESGTWMRVESSREVLLDRDGKAARIVGAIVDVTHRLAADEALRESEERLRLALSAGQMGTWDVDLATERTRWDANECVLLGVREGEVTPSRDAFYQRVHPDDRTLIQQAVERAVERDGDMEYEFRVLHPDGQLRWLAARGQVIKDERDRPVRIIGVNYDVTQRKRIEERLRSFTLELEWRVTERTRELVQSHDRLRALATELNLTEQRERKRLATDLHDYLAQLLALVRMKLGQLKRLPPPAHHDLLAETEQVVNEALTYTRTLVTQLSPPVLHEFGLPVALQWLAEQMVRQELSVNVRQSVPDRLELPEDQAVLLFQSVRELLVNVRKHAGTHQATLTIAQERGELVITVQDDGKGGDGAVAAPGQPSPSSSKFGLLSIRERMRAIGGRFDFDSVPGRGTTATLSLPLARHARDEREARDKRDEPDHRVESEKRVSQLSPVSPFSHRIRVLLADDHMMVREGLRGLLMEHADVEVVGEAWDGEEAVAFADRLRPDVIIMDVNMPGLDGLEATRRIKAAFRSIAVVGLSVNASPQVEAAMRASGADAFLSKEAAGEQIYRTVQAAARKRAE